MRSAGEWRATRESRRSEFREPGSERYYSVASTPVGEMLLVSDGSSLVRLELPSSGPWVAPPLGHLRDDRLLDPVACEIAAYFDGDLLEFSVPLAPSGTTFQREVWRALIDIGYGTTTTYGEIAARIGRPRASRAVGRANHLNPIALVIPCHRVIGADGSLTGYGGGLALKEVLLGLESEVVARRGCGPTR